MKKSQPRRIDAGKMKSALHFVGFKNDRIRSAIRVFGRPDFWHRVYDARAIAEIMRGDTVVFADEDENQMIRNFTWNDSERF